MIANLLFFVSVAALPAAQPLEVVYAPDVVGVDRMFMVALKVPTAAPAVEVRTPDGITCFDRTRLPAKTETRRFYFRASKATTGTQIRFSLGDRSVAVPIEVWSFDDLRKQRQVGKVQLPRRWPLGQSLPELKTRQTFPSPPAAAKARKSTDSLLAASDDLIWSMQPDSTIPRWHWTNIQMGCPVHGKEIYRNRAYYPWKFDDTPPYRWKIRCPIGGEAYPSNDFAAGDMTSGDFPDDGIGGGCEHEGHRYGFIAEISQQYCRRMMVVAPHCSRRYVATGDPQYVHKALVALSRLAVEYAYLATMTQHRHRNTVRQVERFGPGRFADGVILTGGFTTYPIEQPGNLVDHAEAYDRIFPAIDADDEIIPFLRRKGISVNSHEDVRRFIEENLFAVWMQGVMDGACASNEPNTQRALVRGAAVLNYARGNEFLDWLYDGEGRMRVFLPNAYFRDGSPYESTGGYNSAHVVYLTPIAEDVEKLRQLRPEVYPAEKYPTFLSRRYHNIFDFCMDTVTIDRSFPAIGDSGAWPQYRPLPQITWHDASVEAFEHAYRLFRDPKFAWALARTPGWKPSAAFPFSVEEIRKEAARWPDDWNDRSGLYAGYGIAILRSGQGDHKRALWLRYGSARSHTQDDLMDIGLDAHRGVLLAHMGYPRNWGYWEHSWTSHHVARQFPRPSMTGRAEWLAEAPGLQLTEVRAEAASDRADRDQRIELLPDAWQRRTLALVDIDAERFYAVDFYRISGGREHWWAFHGQEGEFQTEGIGLSPPRPGTLAGEDVPYGDPKWLKANGCGYGVYGWAGERFGLAHLYNVRHADAGQKPWLADWRLKSGDGLHLRLHVPSATNFETNVCDGTSPAGGKPYEMKWIMLRRQGSEPLQSQVTALLETYRDRPAVRGVQAIRLSGDDEGGLPAQACEVTLEGRRDVLLQSARPEVQRAGKPDLRFAGRFGFCSERAGAVGAMTLVGGTLLAKGGWELRLTRPELREKIVKVDRSRRTITIGARLDRPEAAVGSYVFIANPVRRVAYQVIAARAVPEGLELEFNYDSRIGTGCVTGASDYKVQTKTPFPLQRFRYYHGARIMDASGRHEYRLLEARQGVAAMIDPAVHPEAKAAQLAVQFPVGTWFEIYDYGVGDEVVWPYTATLQEQTPGVYRLSSPVAASVKLPAGCRLEGN